MTNRRRTLRQPSCTLLLAITSVSGSSVRCLLDSFGSRDHREDHWLDHAATCKCCRHIRQCTTQRCWNPPSCLPLHLPVLARSLYKADSRAQLRPSSLIVATCNLRPDQNSRYSFKSPCSLSFLLKARGKTTPTAQRAHDRCAM
jgi:hypothetical protein